MGLLAPLYALAALAIVGPILFHLIRRQPQGQLPFSSLMFLSPSPPRLTRRSRLDNLLLLLLRALAILLIAIAFTRPYLRQESFLNSTLSGRHIVVILDTSGSMQRADVWNAAKGQLNQLIDDLSVNDHVALYTIDATLTPVVALEQEGIADAAASQQLVRSSIDQLQPSWHRTRLAEGLKSVADLVNAASIAGRIDPAADHEIVLITDLHAESELESLQGYPWPEKISLDVRQVRPSVPGNARVSLMAADEQAESEGTYRVRVENNADSKEQTFQLTWSDRQQPVSGSATTIQVPAGQVRVVPMVARPTTADRIVLLGDAWDGDNAAFAVEAVTSLERIAYVGRQSERPESDLSYFLEQAPLSTELFRREVIKLDAAGLPAVLAEPETKAVVLEPTDAILGQAELLRRFADGGGTVIANLSSPAQDPNAVAKFLDALLAVEGITLSESQTDDFALMSSIDFQHPVFAPFADPRFNDFGKIRFWSHRRVNLPSESNLEVVASFDDQSPMLVEQSLGTGRIWLMTSGWQPEASGLGLSSKFVPIVMGLLDPSGKTRQAQLTFEVGDRIPLESYGECNVTDDQGRAVDESLAVQSGSGLQILVPGLYWLQGENLKRQIAVQLPASESRLVPMDTDVFEQYGIALGKVESTDNRLAAVWQLKVEELEKKQRLWQWLLVAGIVVLAVETFVAGWLARKSQLQPTPA
jgi:hypothetical protein